MPDNLDLILTLTGSLAAAALLGYVTQRLGLSPIVGYLLAGVAVGPHTPGFVADAHVAEQLAEVGVILLMFGVGLHFHLDDLLAVRRVALPGALGQSLVATAVAVVVFAGFGVPLRSGAVIGMAMAVASVPHRASRHAAAVAHAGAAPRPACPGLACSVPLAWQQFQQRRAL